MKPDWPRSNGSHSKQQSCLEFFEYTPQLALATGAGTTSTATVLSKIKQVLGIFLFQKIAYVFLIFGIIFIWSIAKGQPFLAYFYFVFLLEAPGVPVTELR